MNPVEEFLDALDDYTTAEAELRILRSRGHYVTKVNYELRHRDESRVRLGEALAAVVKAGAA